MEKFTGLVEADGTYICGKGHNKHPSNLFITYMSVGLKGFTPLRWYGASPLLLAACGRVGGVPADGDGDAF